MNKKKLYITDDRKNNGLSSISKTILPYAKEVLGKHGLVEIDILSNWENIAGSELSQYSIPQKITFKRDEKNNGTLHLAVPSGAFALEIKHKEKIIIEKINQYFGYNAVSSLKIIQNQDIPLKEDKPVNNNKSLVSEEEEKYIHSISKPVKNANLRKALENLGRSVLQNNKK